MKLKILTTLSVIIATFFNMSVEASDSGKSDRKLYNSVISADYDDATKRCEQLQSEPNGSYIIKNTVTELLNNAESNTINFSYKLWTTGHQNIVQSCFPLEFRLILDDKKDCKIINKHDDLYMTLSKDLDQNGDRDAYGDEDDHKNSWKFMSSWESNRVYFKIFNPKYNQRLKMGDPVKDDERRVFSSDDATDSTSQWYLQAMNHKGDLLFFIFNRRYSQALKIGKDVVDNEDFRIYGESEDAAEKPHYFGWLIEPM